MASVLDNYDLVSSIYILSTKPDANYLFSVSQKDHNMSAGYVLAVIVSSTYHYTIHCTYSYQTYLTTLITIHFCVRDLNFYCFR